VGDVLAIDQDAAVLDVVEAQQQVDDGGLACARAADQADLLGRRIVRLSWSMTGLSLP